MYKAQRRLVVFGVNVITGILFVLLSLLLLPEGSFLSALIIGIIVFVIMQIVGAQVTNSLVTKVKSRAMNTKETALITSFINKLRFSYTVDDLIDAIHTELEDKGDCSVLYVDRENNYVIYNSPDRLTCSDNTTRVLELNYSERWDDGIFFIDGEFGIVSSIKDARGFFLVYGKKHLYVFCRYTRLFDPIIYKWLENEFSRFE